MKTKITLVRISLLLFFICMLAAGCTSGDKEVKAYADKLLINLNKGTDTFKTLQTAYESADFQSSYAISSFQRTLPSYLATFNDLLSFYKSPVPGAASNDLKATVNLAKSGTEKVISGINTIDEALTSLSNSRLTTGQKLLNEGRVLLNQAGDKYNNFVEAYNAKSKTSGGGTNIFLGILIGTAVLWGLGLLVVNPIAKHFTNQTIAQEYSTGMVPKDQATISSRVNSVFTRNYIITDVIVLSVAGFLMGIVAGWFFIGISWNWRSWPGLIAFIGLSVLGSAIHG